MAGRYAGAAPDGFVADIIAAAAAHRLSGRLYIGCGNGRNLVPLLAAGLDLTGLDMHFFSAAELTSLVPAPSPTSSHSAGTLQHGTHPAGASGRSGK